MKNTFLKKAGAVALAAVMAVTFAPVASLNVFAAAITDAGKETVDLGSNNELNDPTIKSIKISTGGVLKITTAGTFKVDINNHDVTLSLSNEKTTVTIVNSGKTNRQTGVHTVGVDSNSNGGSDTGASIVFAGNFRYVVTDANVKVTLATAAATVNGANVSGSNAISEEYASIPRGSGAQTVVAKNGTVNLSGLREGDTACVATDAAAKTTITATANDPDENTLWKYTTTYTFGYYASRDKNYEKGSSRTGLGTYQDVRYYVGSQANGLTKRALTSKGTPKDNETAILAGIFSDDGVAYKTVKKKTNSNSLTIATSDKMNTPLIASTAIDYTPGSDITDAQKYTVADNWDGSYYNFDITDYVKNTNAYAVIDGGKYRTVAADADLLNDVQPAKSLKIAQTAEYTKKDGNKKASFNLSYLNPDVTIEAPKDLTVVRETVTSVSGNSKSYNVKAAFFGNSKIAKPGEDDAHPEIGDTQVNDPVAAVGINVLQVAEGLDKTFTLVGADSKAGVDRVSGVGYYRTATKGTTGEYDYTFGTTDVVSKEFVDNAQGTTVDGLYANPEFRDGSVFASKEIKTTVKGVNPDVTMLGEISAEATATAADGSKTWEINLADTATNDKAVVAYRLYDGNRGEHIYTYNAKERDMLVAAGWKEETSDIKVLPVDAKTGVTVYRVYNPNNGGAHVFTTNPAEVKMLLDAGWEEGVAVFKTPAAGTANTLPVYRVYNTGSKNGEHQFTTSAAEKDNLVNHGWKLEGTPWYSFK